MFGLLLILIYINGIENDIPVIGFGTLFADYTSIGHSAPDEASLKILINIDLDNLNDWYEK